MALVLEKYKKFFGPLKFFFWDLIVMLCHNLWLIIAEGSLSFPPQFRSKTYKTTKGKINSQTGAVYVIYGRSTPPSQLSVEEMSSVIFHGQYINNRFGYATQVLDFNLDFNLILFRSAFHSTWIKYLVIRRNVLIRIRLASAPSYLYESRTQFTCYTLWTIVAVTPWRRRRPEW